MKNKKISIYRPLVFLCGPAIDKDHKADDRRSIVSKYLFNKIQNISVDKSEIPFYMIPVIVDDVLDETFMADHCLEYKKVEEIIALISQRTYVFLDSLSTSYELGLFDSTLSKNKTVVFLEKTFPNRERRAVGEYILKSVPHNKLICYDSIYKDEKAKENEFVSFPTDESGKSIIPEEIKKHIDSDFEALKKKAEDGLEIKFVEKEASNLKQIEFNYDYDNNSISFALGTRLAFYLTLLCFSNNEKSEMNKNNSYSEGYEKFKNLILDLLISSEDSGHDFNTKQLMLLKPEITIHIGKYDNPEEIFRYFICITNRISYLLKQDFDDSFKSLKANIRILPAFEKDNAFFVSFFNLKEHETSLINDYLNNPNAYIDELTMKISGKKRKIIKYKDSHKGRHLRRLHEKIANLLQRCFTPSKYAFAYKKESSVKKCIEEHIESSHFLKLDIHSFFNSITLHKLSTIFKKRFDSEMVANHKKVLPSTIELEDILRCCFYRKKLPLGFVTSPILSDIFMNQTDLAIGDAFKDLIYTRYADDILISSQANNDDLHKCISFIENEINNLGLTLNPKKRANVIFKHYGDSIHYLGVNIVYRQSKNELTISKKTICICAKKINKEIQKQNPDYSKISGLERYVRSISEKSFKNLCKTYYAFFKSFMPIYL